MYLLLLLCLLCVCVGGGVVGVALQSYFWNWCIIRFDCYVIVMLSQNVVHNALLLTYLKDNLLLFLFFFRKKNAIKKKVSNNAKFGSIGPVELFCFLTFSKFLPKIIHQIVHFLFQKHQFYHLLREHIPRACICPGKGKDTFSAKFPVGLHVILQIQIKKKSKLL